METGADGDLVEGGGGSRLTPRRGAANWRVINICFALAACCISQGQMEPRHPALQSRAAESPGLAALRHARSWASSLQDCGSGSSQAGLFLGRMDPSLSVGGCSCRGAGAFWRPATTQLRDSSF